LGDDRAALGEQRGRAAPRRRSPDRPPGRQLLAKRDGGSRVLCRREHGEHRGDRARRAGTRMVGGTTSPGAADSIRRRRQPRCRLAGGARVTLLAAAGNGKALWYATRGTGVVALLLLTSALVLGVLTSARWRTPKLPRFVVGTLHRNLSLLAIAF